MYIQFQIYEMFNESRGYHEFKFNIICVYPFVVKGDCKGMSEDAENHLLSLFLPSREQYGRGSKRIMPPY